MDKSEMFVRIGLQRGILPIGTAIKLNGKHYTYYISPKLFKDYTGIKYRLYYLTLWYWRALRSL